MIQWLDALSQRHHRFTYLVTYLFIYFLHTYVSNSNLTGVCLFPLMSILVSFQLTQKEIKEVVRCDIRDGR